MKNEKVCCHTVCRVLMTLTVSLVMLLSGLTGCGTTESGEKTSPSDLPVKSAPFFEDKETEDSLNRFLDSFVRYHALRWEDEWKYDSDYAAESNLLACLATPESCADWTMYSDVP